MLWLPRLCAGNTPAGAHNVTAGLEGKVSVVYVTVPAPGAEDVAKTLAGSIIENKLAACVNILPGLLVYTYLLCFSNSCHKVMQSKSTLYKATATHLNQQAA